MKNFTVTSNRTPAICVSLVTSTISTPHYIQVTVVGHASWIAEIAEIMAWIGSALRSSTTSDGIQLCSPAIGQDPGNPTSHGLTCRISYSMESQPRDKISLNGKCWHGLFRAPVIAKGFPISRRPASRPGLEIPLGMMATLTATTRLNSFNGKWVIKGFSTMLLPTHYEKDIMMWHLLYDAEGERISYSQGTKLSTVETHVSSFQTARHILGWCSQSRLYAGLIPPSTYHIVSVLMVTQGPMTRLTTCSLHGFPGSRRTPRYTIPRSRWVRS
jgi:hypothetical protein